MNNIVQLPQKKNLTGGEQPIAPALAPAYAELAVTTNFSFLRGASHPEEFVKQARILGLTGIGVADQNSVAGVVRVHAAAREINRKIEELNETLGTNAPALKIAVGARLVFDDDSTPDILAYPEDRAAWGRLTRLLSLGKRRADKGDCLLGLTDLLDFCKGLNLIVMPPSPLPPRSEAKWRGGGGGQLESTLIRLKNVAPRSVWLAATLTYRGDDTRRLKRLATMANDAHVPLIAVNDVLYHAPKRRPLQDIVTCIREHVTIDTAGRLLQANAERHLKPPQEMMRLFRRAPQAIEQTVTFLNKCSFSLEELRSTEYPKETRQGFATSQEALVHFATEGAKKRYGGNIPKKIQKALQEEFELIAARNYAPFFLTVHSIVQHARSLQPPILCQGRGSAANSAVCYCLGITQVDPDKRDLLFSRFISEARDEPPDIDVDFEHARREEVIQNIYKTYSRERAGLAATVICYRGRSAIRDVGKAFGLSDDTIGVLARTFWGWSMGGVNEKETRRAGFDSSDRRLKMARSFARVLAGFPRHLSQHVGGFVMTQSRLDEVVPVENAAMEDRTVIEWDKDDLDALGLLKVDVLGLGMLSCLRRAFDLLQTKYGEMRNLSLQDEDEATYKMIQSADTLGVFQIESRAQMSMLPRLKPKQFYDLVIEVAIVRPGPIQGKMVHPYLRRRTGVEKVDYPSPDPKFGDKNELRNVLEKTLGVPLFQEQAMRIAIDAAGFPPAEADKLRRAMATFKRTGTIKYFRAKFVHGMERRGYKTDFAERCFNQIEGFGEYGFPESHAESFANLVYASAWIKCRYPDVFAAALLNSQPMGFYAPAQIVRDAREHGVDVRPVDVNVSDWDCALETLSPRQELPCPLPLRERATRRFSEKEGVRGEDHDDVTPHPIAFADAPAMPSPSREEGANAAASPQARIHPRHAEMAPHIRTTHAMRLGFRQISGFSEDDALRIESVRGRGFDSMRDLWLRTRLPPSTLERLANADAFGSLGLDRRDALWAVRALRRAGDKDDLPLFARAAMPEQEPDVALPAMPPGERVVEDYKHLHLSLRAHPVSFLRRDLERRGAVRHEVLPTIPNGQRVTVAGLVLVRQRPGTAKGVIFMTLEDETGIANTIVWPKAFEQFRPQVLGARLVSVTGPLQSASGVIHVVAEQIDDLTPLLRKLSEEHVSLSGLARADEGSQPPVERHRHPRAGDALVTLFREAPSSHDDIAARTAKVMPKGRNFH